MTITAAAPRASAYRGRLRWWTELPLIAVIYALYSIARLLVRGDVDDAVSHGAAILHFERILHLDPERWVNKLFTEHAFLGVPADFDYASLHYIVTPTILVWLWRRRPTHYRTARTWLMISTLIGLCGFTAVPTAPPRLLSGHGFVDTMSQYGSYGWWGTDASAPRGLGHLTNQYAAMPSLHVGWSLWCGVMLWRHGRNPVIRTLGVLYPLTTSLVVMGTANHYLMDALAGAATMSLGLLLARPALRLSDRVYAKVAPEWFERRSAAARTATGAVAVAVTEARAGTETRTAAEARTAAAPVTEAHTVIEQRTATDARTDAGAGTSADPRHAAEVPAAGEPGTAGEAPAAKEVSATGTLTAAVPPPRPVDDEGAGEAAGGGFARGEHAGRSRMS